MTHKTLDRGPASGSGWFLTSRTALLVTSMVGLLVAGLAGADDGQWIAKANWPTARGYAAAATASDGKIYVIGGSDGIGGGIAIVDEYDPETDSWTQRANMPMGRSALAAAAAETGEVYAFGGDNRDGVLATVEEYDPVADVWTPRASMPTARTVLQAVAAGNGKIYAIGGEAPTAGSWHGLATVEEYDPATDTWTMRSSMPTPRWGFGAVAASNGKIYAIGGTNTGNDTSLSTVEEYDPATDTWTTRAPMPTARQFVAAAATADGRIYAIGGWRWGEPWNLATVEEYDPATDVWTARSSIPTPRYGILARTASNGKIYAIGGWDGQRGDLVDGFTPPSLAATVEASHARLWVGLRNSDDQGTRFDLRAALYIGEALVAEGTTLCITGITRNAARAKEVSIAFGPAHTAGVASGSLLSLKLFARIGTNPDGSKCPGHSNAVGLRLYYDAVSRPSRVGVRITPEPLADHFLRAVDGALLLQAASPTSLRAEEADAGPVKFAGGNQWVGIGTWTHVIP